jgi:hypothetical protein
MKPRHKEAAETKMVLKAVCKLVEVEKTRKYEARSEEATEMRTQQECILSGGVYLRYRLGKSFLKEMSALLSPCGYYTATVRGVQRTACWRTGVQETVPLFD